MDDSDSTASLRKWYFPDDNSPLSTGINSLKFDTSDDQVKMFVRELCQNSCDASAGGKVTIEFELFRIPKDSFPDRIGFIQTLEECKNTVKCLNDDPTAYEVFNDMIDLINQPEIAVMRASDFGTTGALGSDEKRALIPTPWKSMTTSRGISNKGGKSGGSFGRGKDSFYAVSGLHTVFFSTNDAKGLKASIGCSNLITHYSESEVKKDAFGIYGDSSFKENYSIPEIISFGSFSRKSTETGTDVYIMGYALEPNDWEDRIILAVIKDFFLKIQKGYLRVNAGNKYVDQDNLLDTIGKLTSKYPLEANDLGLLTEQVQLLSRDPLYVDDYFTLYLSSSDRYNHITSIRSGMVIDRRYRTVPSVIGLLVIDNEEISKLLSKCEPTNHDKWVKSNLQNVGTSYKNRILKILKYLSDGVDDLIDKFTGRNDAEMQDAEGLEKYLSLHNDSPEQIQVARKEYNWGVIAEVKPKRKKKVKKHREDPASVKQNPVEMLASEKDPEGDFDPTGAVDRKDKPHGEASRHFEPDENGDMKRRFKVSPSVKITDLNEACSKTDSGIKCAFIFNINKESEYYLRVSAVMKGGKSAEQVPLIKVTDSDGNEIGITDSYYAGPIVSDNDGRNRLDVILNYPTICDFRPEVFEHAD